MVEVNLRLDWNKQLIFKILSDHYFPNHFELANFLLKTTGKNDSSTVVVAAKVTVVQRNGFQKKQIIFGKVDLPCVPLRP